MKESSSQAVYSQNEQDIRVIFNTSAFISGLLCGYAGGAIVEHKLIKTGIPRETLILGGIALFIAGCVIHRKMKSISKGILSTGKTRVVGEWVEIDFGSIRNFKMANFLIGVAGSFIEGAGIGMTANGLYSLPELMKDMRKQMLP